MQRSSIGPAQRAITPGVERACSPSAAVFLGHADTAISDARHGVALDPLNPLSHRALGDALRYARRYEEAIAAYQAAMQYFFGPILVRGGARRLPESGVSGDDL
jgi:hypothetical protein